MKQYHELLKDILINGDVQYDPRTEEQVLGISGHLSKYDLREGFPLVTTKKVAQRLVFEELFWKLRGERNVKPLFDRNVHIWDGNAFDHYLKRHKLTSEFPKHTEKWEVEFVKYKKKIGSNSKFAVIEGDMGPIYGYQWRHWKKPRGKGVWNATKELFFGQKEIDQLKNVIRGIKEKPGSRYHVMSAWNVGELGEMALGPCPFWHQFTVYGDNLDLHTVQRSCDVYLGVPFNIGQESALLQMIAGETGLKPRKFLHDYINVHIYLGVSPRAEFLRDKKNLDEFQRRAKSIENPEEYLELKEWYTKEAPAEGKGQERKDHMPFVLEQLSKETKEVSSLSLQPIPLFEAIQKPVGEIIKAENYEYHDWDSSARMAA